MAWLNTSEKGCTTTTYRRGIHTGTKLTYSIDKDNIGIEFHNQRHMIKEEVFEDVMWAYLEKKLKMLRHPSRQKQVKFRLMYTLLYSSYLGLREALKITFK